MIKRDTIQVLYITSSSSVSVLLSVYGISIFVLNHGQITYSLCKMDIPPFHSPFVCLAYLNCKLFGTESVVTGMYNSWDKWCF